MDEAAASRLVHDITAPGSLVLVRDESEQGAGPSGERSMLTPNGCTGSTIAFRISDGTQKGF